MCSRSFLELGALCVLAFLGIAGYAFVEMWYYQAHIGKELEKELGFRHGSPYVRCGNRFRAVFTIETVESGGAFARAGFQSGDIVRGLSITRFFKILHRARGTELSVTVIKGGDGPPLAQRPSREIRIVVPIASRDS